MTETTQQPVMQNVAADNTVIENKTNVSTNVSTSVKTNVFKLSFDNSKFAKRVNKEAHSISDRMSQKHHTVSNLSERPISLAQRVVRDMLTPEVEKIYNALSNYFETLEPKTETQRKELAEYKKAKDAYKAINEYKAKTGKRIGECRQWYKDTYGDWQVETLMSVKKDKSTSSYDLFEAMLYNQHENEAKEDDERATNHPKTGTVAIQHNNAAITHHYMKKMFREKPKLFEVYQKHHVLLRGSLEVIAGFYLGIDENGYVDPDLCHFVNNLDNTILDSDEEIFDFKFKLMIERYSSANADDRYLDKKQHEERIRIETDFFENFDYNPEITIYNAITKKSNPVTYVRSKNHTVTLQPVIAPCRIRSINDMKRMIARFYNCQGIKFERDDDLLQISNSEHGFGQPVVYEIRDTEIKDGKLVRLASSKGYKMVYHFDANGHSLNFEQCCSRGIRSKIECSLEKYKEKNTTITTTESRHYGGDVLSAFHGTNMAFGTGIKFDNYFLRCEREIKIAKEKAKKGKKPTDGELVTVIE